MGNKTRKQLAKFLKEFGLPSQGYAHRKHRNKKNKKKKTAKEIISHIKKEKIKKKY